MSNPKPRITVVGSSNTDMVVKSAQLPRPGETVLGGQFIIAHGGKGANQAVAAARLGAQVTLVARLGADIFGDQALDSFKRESIDISYMIRDDLSASGVALILVDDAGENLISVAPGANACLSVSDVDRAAHAITSADALLLQLETPLDAGMRAAQLAKSAGVRVILDPAPAPREGLPREFLSCVDILTPNETEAAMLSGVAVDASDAASVRRCYDALRQLGVGTLILTAGSGGAWIVSDGNCDHVEARRVDAVDATAAGDCFAGALACALAEGRALGEAVDFGCRAAAISVTRLGAQPSMPWREEVEPLS